MTFTAKQLEFIATNVQIAANLHIREISGKRASDWMNWEHKINENPSIELLVLRMEEL